MHVISPFYLENSVFKYYDRNGEYTRNKCLSSTNQSFIEDFKKTIRDEQKMLEIGLINEVSIMEA
ncbi:hypothetical protein COE80_18230 [Bacillus pseudomycoides]|nr:hypothetical protein COE80_18230 [Bacillus pseudomycoides]PHC76644.1 hypothetical protein COF38_10855 [Bacillus pseudomycoides]